MLAFASIPIQPITGRHSLFLASYTRTSISLPCSWLALAGGYTGLPCSM